MASALSSFLGFLWGWTVSHKTKITLSCPRLVLVSVSSQRQRSKLGQEIMVMRRCGRRSPTMGLWLSEESRASTLLFPSCYDTARRPLVDVSTVLLDFPDLNRVISGSLIIIFLSSSRKGQGQPLAPSQLAAVSLNIFHALWCEHFPCFVMLLTSLSFSLTHSVQTA